MPWPDSAGRRPTFADQDAARLYGLLACPRCGASPEPDVARCPGCGRSVVAAGGGLDLLDDSLRADADRFASQYKALRLQEGWIGAGSREDPGSGPPRLWRARLKAISAAAALLAPVASGTPPVLLDIGSGGGWAARYFQQADVIAIDVLDVEAGSNALHVRADMRRLPLRDRSADSALFAASLHYAPIEDVIREAARVLRLGGLMVAVDSPMYADQHRQAQAQQRSADYYTRAGFPELAASYHPIEVEALRSALQGAGFDVLRLETGRFGLPRWLRVAAPKQPSFLVARLMPTR